MRPLKLELEGFTAFKEPVCLDLTQLDLFAITGPTGAGKSSLIDAIAYALYGRVPRVSNEVTSCISQGLDRMLVGLEFMAGEDRYRIFRETRRKGAPNVRLDRWREDGWQPLHDRAKDVNANVADIVGLDYDGFTRSVLLPQGQFQEFLAGSAEKRRAVLSSLLRLQVYESMRRRAASMSAEMRTRIEEREHTLQGLAEATPDNVRRLEGELKVAGGQLEGVQIELKSLEQGMTLATALKQAQDALGRCETEAIQALADFQKTSRVIDEGDVALATVDEQVVGLQAQLEANCYDAERHTALSVALERVRAVAQVQAGIEQATTLHNNAAKQLAGATAAVEKGMQALEETKQARVAAESAWSQEQRQDIAAQSADTERQQALGIARERLQALHQAQAGLDQQEKAHEDAVVQAAGATAAVESREQVLEEARQARLAAESAWSEAQRHDLAATLQQGLKPGDSCPVCGGVIGEMSPLDTKGLQAAEKQLNAARKLEGDALASLTTASSVAARAAATVENCEAQISGLMANIESIERSVAEALPDGIAADVTTIDEALQAHVATRRARQERLEAAEKQLTAARMEEGEALASLSAASEIATRVSATVENCATQIAGLQGSIEALDASVAEVLPEGQDASLAAVETALREQAQARTARIELDAQIKQTTAQCQTMRTQLDEARQHLAALEQRSQAAAEALEAAQEGVTKARESLEAAAGAWPEVGEALRKVANVALVLRHRVDETQAQQAALVKSMGQLETRIEYLKADIEKAEALRLRLAELKQEYNVAADLAQMLGAAKFQTFVQQEALLTLAAHGSTRLEQLSAGRYKLQLDDKGAEFEVVDQWNADMARSVRTLSGGETFLASLALSLALAESLPGLAASRRVVLDSIFLDEGFGSLDAEALDRAADALDALRMDNRMVCIVTHLPELAQRLPARIVVTKTEAGSSVAIA